MSTFYVTNEKQLRDKIMLEISRPLLEYLSKKVVNIMKKHLAESEISTQSMQQGVDYMINATGTESVIEIDYEYVQDFAARPPQFEGGTMIEWGWFTNSIGANRGSQQWKGEWISFRMAEWLEYGGSGNYGNQPISASHWFSKTAQEVKANLNSWVREFLHLYKLI